MNEQNRSEQQDDADVPETVSLSALEATERASADIAVVTAKRYPRTIKAFQADLETWACAGPLIAEECFYVLERKNKDGSKKLIIGPSVRFAELVLAAYRNLMVRVRLESDDGRVVTVVGACRDMERNIGQEVPVSRRVTDRDGRRYSDDMVNVTIQAAAAIAKRNAIMGVVPKALWAQIWQKTMDLARGDIKSIVERIGLAVESFAKVGVTEPRLLAHLGKPSKKDMDADDLLVLHILLREIKAGERDPSTVGVDDPKPVAEAARGADAAVAAGAAKGKGTKNAKSPAAPTPQADKPAGNAAAGSQVETPKSAAPSVPEGAV